MSEPVSTSGDAWRDRVDALSPVQRRALAALLDRARGVPEESRLVGFVVPAHTGGAQQQELTNESLRAFLAERLPDYMVPAHFVAVQRLPRTAAGKLDRAALAVTEGETLAGTEGGPPRGAMPSDAAPLTEAETTLLGIWRDVLKVDEVGIDDDFFEIGGDSLLSIRVIARAGRAGMRIPPERFFERPTIRNMAAVAGAPSSGAATAGASGSTAGSATVSAASIESTGEAPLTPIQHWFLDAIPSHRDWWNQGYLLEVQRPLAHETVRDIVHRLVQRHEALRMRLQEQDGQWRQYFPAADDQVPFRVVDLTAADAADYEVRVTEEADREQAALRLTDGRLFRVVLFDGREGWQRLLLVSHHLIVDGVSWSVLLEDLATLVSQALAQQPLHLVPSPSATSARAWAMGLRDRAATAAVAATASHWLSLPMDGGAMPVDDGDYAGVGVADGRAVVTTNAEADVVTLSLDAGATALLLHDAPRRLDANAQSLLLSALGLAWRSWTGHDVLWLDLEGHGRDALHPDGGRHDVPGHILDVSRTVGWFTTVFPVRLVIPATDGRGAEPETAAVVHSVHRTIEALPMRGAAHGMLRHLAPDDGVRARLAALPRPALLFNYLGTHDVSLAPTSHLRVLDGPAGRTRSPEGIRPYLLELNAWQQAGRLHVTVEYARSIHRRDTIERFASLLCDAMTGISRATPGDRAVAGLDRSGLQVVAALLDALDEPDGPDEPDGDDAS